MIDSVTPEIRPMRSADLDAVLSIAASSPEAPAWQCAHYLAYLTPPEPPLLRAALVALNSGSVIGFAAATLVLDPSGTANPENRCELETIAVDAGTRRQGLGSALLNAVIAWAEERGSRRFILEVRASNSAALRLYERHGFRREGLRPNYYADPVEDAVLLGRTLLRR